MEFKVCPNAVWKPVGSLTLLTDHELVRTHTQNRTTCTSFKWKVKTSPCDLRMLESSVVDERPAAGGDEAPNDLLDTRLKRNLLWCIHENFIR